MVQSNLKKFSQLDTTKKFTRRSVFLLASQITVIGVLSWRIRKLQIEDTERYRLLAEENRVNIRILPPQRGLIFDKTGKLIANNQQNYRVVIIREDAGDIKKVLTDLSKLIPISKEKRDLIEKDIKKFRAFVPVTVVEDISWEQFAKVADALSDMGATCFCIGAPHEYNLVQQIADSANSNVYNLIDKEIPLGSLPSLIAQADLMITNDTGPRHIAVATGVPVITLYGPTDYRWTEYECKNDVPVLADPFLPIQYVADEHPEQCDIQKIPASDVIELAKQFIR